MSKQLWTIVGIVIGALLAGGMQLLLELVRSRSERRRWHRSNQQTAYADFLVCINGIARRTRRVYPPPGSGLPTLNEALNMVRLFAPPDTFNAATSTARSARKIRAEKQGRVPEKKIVREAPPLKETRDAFVKLAQRDLGVTS